MSLNIVSFKAPKFKPLPGELTPAVINGATLPVKVEAAKRAIAACCDLSELLTWKDKLAALAAAAKMARMPEMARDVNRVHKEAIFRMGEILLQYNGESQVRLNPGNGKRMKGNLPSERAIAATNAGVEKNLAKLAAKAARAKKDLRDRILQDDRIPPTATAVARQVPAIMAGPDNLGSRRGVAGHAGLGAGRRRAYSDAGLLLFGGVTREHYMRTGRGGCSGLQGCYRSLQNLDLSAVKMLSPEEKQRARKLVVEMQEILDDIDRRLGPDAGVK